MRAEPGQTAPRPYEGVLCYVFCVGTRAQHTQANAVDGGLVAAHDLLKGGYITALRGLHQNRVINLVTGSQRLSRRKVPQLETAKRIA